MTRDERMSLLLNCVDYYAHAGSTYHDGGRKAREVLLAVAKDELDAGLLEELRRHNEQVTKKIEDEQ